MRRTVPVCIDHFAFSVTDKAKAMAVGAGLGFVTGEQSTDNAFHYHFDNCYMEVLPISTRFADVKESTLVGVLLSADDPDAAHRNLKEAGFEVAPADGPMNSSRYDKHGLKTGFVTFRTFLLKNTEPFSKDRFFGVAAHLSQDIMFQKERYLHVNNAYQVESISFYAPSEDALKAAEEQLVKLDSSVKRTAVKGHYMKVFELMDREEYLAEFGSEAPACDLLNAAAVTFGGCDQAYVENGAKLSGLNCFYKGGKLYVDARTEIGAFLIFK